MKRLLKILPALAICSAALCLSAAAAEADALAPIRVWGQVSPWDGTGIFLKNDDGDDPMGEVVVHVGDAPVVNAADGLPLDLESVKEGDTLYAWVGPAATMSLPPQVFAQVVVGNVPADADAPEYCEIAGAAVSSVPGGEGNPVFPLTGGGTLEVTGETVYTPWLTRQIVRMEDLTPGTHVLAWKDADGRAEKVLVFPYGYKGYLTTLAASHGDVLAAVNGGFDAEADRDVPQFQCRRSEGGVMVPVRAVAEAAGYEVRWDRDLGAVVSLNGETVFSVRPGADVLQTPEGESGLAAPCVLENGVTYLEAEDLCHYLNLFLVRA